MYNKIYILHITNWESYKYSLATYISEKAQKEFEICMT